MSKNASGLKSAIQNLNIKKPYDLRSKIRPSFNAPKDGQTEQPEIKHAQSMHAENKHDRNEIAQTKYALNEQGQNVIAQIEHTDNEHAQTREPRSGFFMLAHSVFENELTQKLSGDAFKVFIWMSSQAWRYQHSNGEFRGAVEYISMNTGCSRSTVTRALRDLRDLKLIECVEQNYKKGNLWRVSDLANGRGKNSDDKDVQNKVAQIEHSQNEVEACSKRSRSMLILNKEHAQNEHHLISSNKIKNKSEEAPEDLIDMKNLWEKFYEKFPNEAEQTAELQKRLEGLPFASKHQFGKNMAVMKWWDSLGKT